MKLRDAIELAAHVAAKAGPLAILNHLKIADGRIVSTDTTQQIDVPVELPKGIAKAAFCVHGARLQRVLKALPEDLELDLTLQDTLLLVRAGKTHYQLNTLPAGDFPNMETAPEDSTGVEVDSKPLVDALRFIAPAMAINDIRYYLCGAQIAVEPHRLVITSTDGARLHRVSLKLPPDVAGEAIRGIVANASIARVIELAGRHERIMLTLSPNRFGVEDDEVLLSKLVEGTYPDTARVIPKSRPATAGVPRAALLAAVKRMTAIAPEAVSLGYAKDCISLGARNKDGEVAGEAFEWNASGAKIKPYEQAFQTDYLTDALGAFTCERINLHLADDAAQALYLTDDDDGSHEIVLMPRRV